MHPVGSDVNPRQNDFFKPFLHQSANLLQDQLRRHTSTGASNPGDNTVRTFGITTVLNLDKGSSFPTRLSRRRHPYSSDLAKVVLINGRDFRMIGKACLSRL